MRAAAIRECNTGGPRSRSRTEVIRSSVLGDDGGPIRCPQVHRLGLAFGDRKPLDVVDGWLAELGFADEEVARAHVDVPADAFVCQSDPAPTPLVAADLDARTGLRVALMLGLCSSTYYAPDRPVIWTHASLTRQLLLFAPEGFYA